MPVPVCRMRRATWGVDQMHHTTCHAKCQRLVWEVLFVRFIALFPILADLVKVKIESGSSAHWSTLCIRLNGWLRHSFALLGIDGIGQN